MIACFCDSIELSIVPRRSSLALHNAVSEPESRQFSRCRTANVAAAPCPYPASGAASRSIEPYVSTTIVSTEGSLRRVSLSTTSRYRLLPSHLANTLGNRNGELFCACITSTIDQVERLTIVFGDDWDRSPSASDIDLYPL